MATEDENKQPETEDAATSEGTDLPSESEAIEKAEPEHEEHEEEHEAPAAGQLGSSRYVIAFFFVTGIAAAFVIGKLINAIWAQAAESTWVQKNMTFLARLGEDDRGEYTTLMGAVLAIIGVVYAYRRADVRQWTDDVASELQKVTWPDKSEVTSSTVIVIITSAFATLYLALLDRFWGFVTNLVYGG